MKARSGFVFCTSILGSIPALGGCAMPAATPAYESGLAIQYGDVQSLLDAKCTSCHTGADAARGLRLDSWQALFAGSDHGEAVIPFDAARSLMVELTTKLVGGPHPAEVGGVPLIVAWSPDGRYLAYGSVTGLPYTLNVVERGVWTPQQYTLVDGFVGELAWSPDGHLLAVSSYS